MAGSDLERGTMIGDRYRIDGKVGRGGMGAVYRAFDTREEREVALKVLLANYSSRLSDSKRFEREASLVKKLDHPNIVELLDYGQTKSGEPYIAFELLHGRSLRDALEDDGALPFPQVVQVTRDIIQALEAAHKLGIVHRDIKPQNVFLSNGDPPRALVLDFGVAKALGGEEAVTTDLTQAGQIIGSPHYMSPEQVRGKKVQPATDIYALGLLIAEMITGERVVKGDAPIEVYMLHVDPEPLPMSPVVKHTPLGELVKRACSKEPSDRYKTATEMLKAFESAMLNAAGPGDTFVMGVDDDSFAATHEAPVANLEETVVMTEGVFAQASSGKDSFNKTVDDFAITVDRGFSSPEELRAAALAAMPVDAATVALESPADLAAASPKTIAMETEEEPLEEDRAAAMASRPPFSSTPPAEKSSIPPARAQQSTAPPANRGASSRRQALAANPQLKVTFTKQKTSWTWIVTVMLLLLILGFVLVAWWLRANSVSAPV